MVTRKNTGKKRLKIEFRQYSNKSRKGTYLYIKATKTKPALYKYKGQEIDPIIEYYWNRHVKKRKARKQEYIKEYQRAIQHKKAKKATRTSKQMDRYVKKIASKPILKQIRKGKQWNTITNSLGIGQAGINKANKNLFQRIVLHKDILKVLVTENNLTKLRHLHEHQITFIDSKGKTAAEATITNKTITEVCKTINQYFKQGEEIDSPWHKKLKTVDEHASYVPSEETRQLKTVKIKTIFRRA